MIPDMTPNRMLLDVSVSPEKDTTILILISMKFNYIVLFFPNWDHFIITIYILVRSPMVRKYQKNCPRTIRATVPQLVTIITAPKWCYKRYKEKKKSFLLSKRIFFYTYLPINNHFQLIIITNVSFVTSPSYFVSHLATPVVSFLRSHDFSNSRVRVVYILLKIFFGSFRRKWEFGSCWHIFFNK
jgi:hypothetical protein